MRKLISLIAVAALFAGAVPAADAAKRVPYKGKTAGGHGVTFNYAKGMMWDFVTGVPMTCLPIQGGGSPQTGAEVWNFKWVKVGLKDYKFSEQSKPSFHYNEVTRNHTVTTRRARNGTISGSIRVQYSFMVPKYPIGTFSVYSCLGNTTFSARQAR
jgi:hypothetical protein